VAVLAVQADWEAAVAVAGFNKLFITLMDRQKTPSAVAAQVVMASPQFGFISEGSKNETVRHNRRN
jgi:hypothetical protein